MTAFDEKYWSNRYQNGQTQWDAGAVTTPFLEYFNTLANKHLKILIPGGGNGYEAAYLHEQGFTEVYLLDISPVPLQQFAQRNPSFPKEHLLLKDFFELEGSFDLMLEQTFFCALDPKLRPDYARKASELLRPGGKLVGLLFNDPLNEDHPPFGGNKKEYEGYFQPHFQIRKMELCYNSIAPRKGRELWIELEKE